MLKILIWNSIKFYFIASEIEKFIPLSDILCPIKLKGIFKISGMTVGWVDLELALFADLMEWWKQILMLYDELLMFCWWNKL